MNAASHSTGLNSPLIRKILLGAVFLCLFLQFFMALKFEVNQDEFYNLNMGYEFLRGEISNPFQTIMFRISGLFSFLPGNEVDQIVAGRMLSFLAAALTCFFIFKISRRYFSVEASLFAVLVFFGFNYVFRHLTAFRADILVTMCLMALLWVVSDPNQTLRKAVIAGGLIGLACTLSLKSIFYMPIIAIFLLGRWAGSQWSRAAFVQGLVMFLAAIAAFAIIFILHNPATQGSEQGADYLRSVSGSSLLGSGLFNRWGIFVVSLFRSFLGWGLVLAGFCVVLLQIRKTGARPKVETIALASFIIPLTPVIYYYHANPYFYPFMLAPAMVFVAAAADRFFVGKKSIVFVVFLCIFTALPVGIFIRSMSQPQTAQRTVINAVHEIFPEPVPVIDYSGMISSFDRVNESGLFINPDIFAHSTYLKSKTPKMAHVITTYKPQILLANVLGLDLNEDFEHAHRYVMLEEDTRILKDNYIQFWGPVYVPGKVINKAGEFEILMGGTYTYEGPPGVRIDGMQIIQGQVIDLTTGTHEISGWDNGQVRLVWGDNLKKPDIEVPTRPLFNGS
ncbi:MAG: hypothetical protein EX271_01335 [Acidimicrobiales bacterium]|nr:MAG: hypothetical protein EX271_01335 [Acidimicrobiales bacterium]